MEKALARLKIRQRLILVFGIVIVLSVGAVAAGIAGNAILGGRIEKFYKEVYQLSSRQYEVRRDGHSLMKNTVWLCTSSDPDEIARLTAEAEKDAAAMVAAYQYIKDNSDDAELLNKLDGFLAQAATLRGQIMQYVADGDNASAYMIFEKEYAPVATEFLNGMLDIAGEVEAQAEGYYTSSEILHTVIIVVLAALLVLMVAVSVVLVLKMARMIIKPLEELETAAQAISHGNLETEITYHSKDELGSLAHNFRKTVSSLKILIEDLDRIIGEFAKGNFDVRSGHPEVYTGSFEPLLRQLVDMVRKVSETLGDINDASGQVAAGSDQLSNSAQSLASGATEQAAAVEELLATVSDVTQQVLDNAKETDKTHDRAKVVGREAEVSQQKIQELVEAMGRISDTSKEIEKIIVTIEEIASQTNMLSLNASIEAARAGDAGRGFAVVADQIGKLADDSARSAVMTKKMIETSLEEVHNGSNIVDVTATAMNTVITELDEILMAVANIRVASDRQAESMKGMEKGVEQISAVIQNNSAVAEEFSATSEELSAQAESLSASVGQFVLRKE